jgi:broad specificity phosphatase PhoE
MQVAEEISQAVDRPVSKVDGLKELDLGDLEGVSGEEMREGWRQVYDAWRDNPAGVSMPNGESLAQLQDRAWQAFLDLEAAHQDDDTLILVSHNFAIRTIVCKLLGVPLANFHKMILSLSSICTIDSGQWGRRLVNYNSTGHLSPRYK